MASWSLWPGGYSRPAGLVRAAVPGLGTYAQQHRVGFSVREHGAAAPGAQPEELLKINLAGNMQPGQGRELREVSARACPRKAETGLAWRSRFPSRHPMTLSALLCVMGVQTCTRAGGSEPVCKGPGMEALLQVLVAAFTQLTYLENIS